MQTLVPTVESYRQSLSAIWSDATANPRSRPLPEGMPPSHGHCEVASAVIFGSLARNFEAHWRLVHGRVLAIEEEVGRTILRPIIAGHCWIDFWQDRPTSATVVDITGDQANHQALGSTVVEPYNSLNEQGIVYQPWAFFDNMGDFEGAMTQYNCDFDARFARLQEKFDQLVG
jgi:hypothetical protein